MVKKLKMVPLTIWYREHLCINGDLFSLMLPDACFIKESVYAQFVQLV